MKRIFLILSIILLTCACSEPIVETFGNISGVVRDSRTNEPVEGVKVTLTPTGASQVTDIEGSFLFDNLDPQEFTLMFTKSGTKSGVMCSRVGYARSLVGVKISCSHFLAEFIHRSVIHGVHRLHSSLFF